MAEPSASRPLSSSAHRSSSTALHQPLRSSAPQPLRLLAISSLLLLSVASAQKPEVPAHKDEADGSNSVSEAEFMDPPPNSKYTVITHNVAKPKHRSDFITMTDKKGRKFNCVLPSALTAKQDSENAKMVAEKAVEEAPVEAPLLDTFLDPLVGRCFPRNEGYWNVELCHKKKIRQFHEEGKKTSAEFSLGDYDKMEQPTNEEIAEDASKAVVRHYFSGGTRCDETDSGRHTVVEYRCSQTKENHVALLKEDKVCSYVIQFQSPLLCRHPYLSPSTNTKAQNKVSDYLQGLVGSCFYRVEGWWTYEFCYMKHFKQFHQENNVNTAEFILGLFSFEANAGDGAKDIHVDDGAKQESVYFSQTYNKGTKCDVTGEPRMVEVQFKCATDSLNVISSIKEKSTCKYVVVFQTPLICNHPDFQLKQDPVRNIECYPVSPPKEDTAPQPLLE